MEKVKFYDVKTRRSVMVDKAKTRKVVRNNRHFLVAKGPAGNEMWRITKG